MNTFPWEDLPPETADLIVQALVRRLRFLEEDDSRDATHRARLISHAFRDAVGYLWKLHPPRMPNSNVLRIDAAPDFVDGLLRYTADVLTGGHIITERTYSILYTTVYTWCTQKPPNNASETLYYSLGEVTRALVAEGALRQLDTVQKRDRLVCFVEHCAKYLNRFYVKRLSLPEVGVVLREALVS